MSFATSAIAQHADRGEHQGHEAEQPADPHARHTMPMRQEAQPDPHAGHMTPMERDTDPDPHAGHRMPPAETLSRSGPPSEAFAGPEHAADTVFPDGAMDASRAELQRHHGGQLHYLVSVERFEVQIADGEDGYVWELNGRVGSDTDKLWVKSEGEGAFGDELEEAEIQALWSHAIGPFFDFQMGVRYDVRPEPDRAHAVIGIQGLAPYWFEIDLAAFVSHEGDVTARAEAEYDQRLTQQLILQPRIEVNLSAQDIPELGIGSGITDLEAGLRLRYEIVPQFAPYVGIEWQRQFGDTADFTRAAGGDADRWVALIGMRFWF